jgi:cytoskeletal protein CcmA (bactofilin family)/Flp pilus assembly protein TadG
MEGESHENLKAMKTFWKNEEGSVLVVGIFSITMLLAFLGLAMDVGNLVYTKTLMQNAVDAAAYAGGLAYYGNNASQNQAKTTATTFLHNNGFPSVTPTVTFTQDTTKNPQNLPEINVSMTQTVPTFFITVLGIPNVTLKASAEAVCFSPFNFTLFQGNKNDTLTLMGLSLVEGSMHSNNKILIEGLAGIDGNVEAVNGVTKQGFAWISGTTINNASSMNMPDLSSQVASTVSTSNTYPGDKTFSGTDIINGSIYVHGNLTINGTTVALNGAIMADGDITINGITIVSGNQVALYSRNGNITITGLTAAGFGDSSAGSLIYAPNGTVHMAGITLVHGRIVANALDLDWLGLYFGNYNITSLPVGSTLSSHVKLIN